MAKSARRTHGDGVVALGAHAERQPFTPNIGPSIVAWSAVAKLPTKFGTYDIRAFHDCSQRDHVVVSLGDVEGKALVPVRVHSECLTSEVLGRPRCDCSTQLEMALAYIAEQGLGILIYLRQEGRGTGLVRKIDAYALQDTGLDTVEASRALGLPVDARTYELAGDVLKAYGVASIALLTNNPAKIDSLRDQGVDVARRVPLRGEANEHNSAYLNAKQLKLNHLI